jgi:hypothetical protein
MKAMIFIDGTWLWHNMMYLHANNNHKIDLSMLPQLLITALNKIQKPIIKYDHTILCASIPVNTDPEDYKLISKRQHFFNVLRDRCGYGVELYEIDFHGRRLLKHDRDPTDVWEPKEKCVDIATASNILFYASQYDVAIVVTGDKDFLPALTKARKLGKIVKIASFQGSCSKELIDFGQNIIWIDDFLPEMILYT